MKYRLSDIQKYLLKKIKKHHSEKNLDLDYLAKGYVDSLNFLNFIIEIQNKYKIEFKSSDFKNRGYRTIKGLSKMIFKKIK